MKQPKMNQQIVNKIADAYRFYNCYVARNEKVNIKTAEKNLRRLANLVIECGGEVNRKRIYEKNYLYVVAKELMK